MLFKNRRLEELERMAEASIPSQQSEAEEEKKQEQEEAIRESFRSGELKITAKDVLAMSIAVFSLLLPYILIICAGIGLVVFFMLRGG